MDLADLTLELEDSLNLRQGGVLSEEEWLFAPDDAVDKPSGKTAEEKQNLEKWLRGAVEKVDFRTRSALSRRLEKKKRKADKEKRLKCSNNTDSSLSMIEEVSNESGPMSDREQRMRPREKENMAARKAISEASVCSEDEDDEEYFDAPSTPKKTPQLANSASRSYGKQQSIGRMMPRTGNNGREILGVNGETAKSSGNKGPKRNSARTMQQPTRRQLFMQQEEEDGKEHDEVLVEWRDLSDIERRAKEQERELQMELMRSRCQRLGSTNREMHAGTTVTRPRPDSDSSSTSSVLSGGNASKANAYTPSHLATSKSVDFRSSSGHAEDHSSVTSSRSNEGSLADLSCCSDNLNQPPNSRLPLPRRPTIPGKTGIPLPTPKKTSKNVGQGRKQSPLYGGFEQLDDEECF